jgi:hypothetical protein
MAAGHADAVLAACGDVLRRIHDAGFGHGDFGPNNTLFDPDSLAVTAVLDWEFSWRDRQAAMVERCAQLIEFTHEWEPDGPAEALWRERLRVTAAWRESVSTVGP